MAFDYKKEYKKSVKPKRLRDKSNLTVFCFILNFKRKPS